jgi:formate dehydrogenase major subunit
MARPYVRLTQPLVRDTKGGDLRPASWDEALDRVVAGSGREGGSRPDDLRHVQLQQGDQRGQLRGAEVQPAVLGSNNIDSCNRT